MPELQGVSRAFGKKYRNRFEKLQITKGHSHTLFLKIIEIKYHVVKILFHVILKAIKNGYFLYTFRSISES